MNEQSRPNLRPAWRSMLFVPATQDRYIDKAIASGSDAIIIDLEDSIPPAEKYRARNRVAAVARRLRESNADILVRINRPFHLAVRDIEASVGEDVAGLMVAKAESCEHLEYISEVIEYCERANSLQIGKTFIVPLVESANAVRNLTEICLAPRVLGIACGDEDLAAEIGCAPDSPTITSIKHQLVVAAAGASRHAIGIIGSITDFTNLDRFRENLEISKTAGLRGTLCIHPNQVAIANEVFLPTAQEVAQAESILDAARQARTTALGATSLDGKMIDQPVVRRAEKIIQKSRLAKS